MPTEHEVDETAAGERLDVFLARHEGSRTSAQGLIEAGLVRVDGEPRAKRYSVRMGERVRVADRPKVAVADVAPAEYTVVYRDDDVLVVDKPSGVVVHPARGHRQGTLSQALAAAGLAAGGEDAERPGIVHRLDRDTSGLLVVARNEPAHAALKDQMRAREIAREYVALVEGRPGARKAIIDAPLGRDRKVRTRVSTDTDDPREARTHFEIDRALPKTTLLRVTLDTGRTHQIRAHLKAIGFPVCGDPEYGTPGRHGLTRQFLHAARLAFTHPVSGERIEVHSELPEELATALSAAEAE